MAINCIIRKASVSDIAELQQMSAELIDSDNRFNNARMLREWSLSEDGKKYLLSRIRGKKGICFVAEMDGSIVGYLTGGEVEIQKFRPYKRAEIDNIFVRQSHRNQKIGSQLMDAFSDWAKTRRIDKVFVYAMADNQEVIRFYEKKLYRKYNLVLEKDI